MTTAAIDCLVRAARPDDRGCRVAARSIRPADAYDHLCRAMRGESGTGV